MIAASTDGLPGDLGFSRVDSPLEISSTGPERTAIALHDSPVAIRDTFVDFRAYQVFTLPGEPFLCREGAPAIPHVTRLYHIPNTGSVVPEIRTLEWETVTDVYPLPLQVEKADLNRRREEDPSIYHTDAWYPEQPIFVGPPMVFRDFRVVAVTICPVQVNPMTRQARICRNVEVDLVATDEPGENELMSTRRPSRVFAPLYRSLISNLDESALDEVTDTPGTYLILCKGDTTSQQYADSMATWRRRVGYDVTIDSRSNWTYNSMRSAIVAANNSADPPLEFVCILGDPNSAVGLPTHSSEYDHYFADLTGDHLEDVAVGRLPASSGSQFRLIFAKITAYEREPYMDNPSWFTRAFLYAGEGYDITSNHVTMLWCGRQFVNHTGISDVRISTHGSNQVNNTLIANRLNEGVTYFLWRGTVVNEMSSSAPNGTNNGSKLPVSLTITCGTGDFNSTSGPCLSESWVLAGTPGALKGAVCGIGTATTSTWVHYNNTVAGGLVYNICNLGVEHIGTALAGAKAQLFEAFPYDGNATNFVRWNNLMGDPALALWTQPPVVMNVTHPGTVNVGARRIRPQVTNAQTGQPIRDALVVLWKGDETYERVLTDEFGFADVPVRVDTEGTLTLTVSKRNHKPYLANISCVNATEMATLSSYLLDDDNLNGSSGNGDGILNPGETIDLSTYIGNFGQTDTARQLSGVLTTTLPRVTVVTGTAVFPDIAPGDSALGNSPFRFLSAPTIRNNERVFLTIALTSAARTTHSTLRLICAAGEAVFSNYQVQGGDGDSYLEPGETTNLRVTIQNVGDLTLGNATGVLHSRTSYVSVLGTTATFGTIPPGGSGTSAGTGFLVAANPLSYPGFPAEMLLVLTSDNGHVDSVVFVVPLGNRQSTDPTGPDAYGYYAYDNTDINYEHSRSFSYVPITGSGLNLNLNDPGEQQPGATTYSTVRSLPFPFMFYGVEYGQITICSNGWAAFGDQHELDMFRNYPIPGQQAPDAMIAPFWDDLATSGSGRGVWEYYDAANHRYIVQWKAVGAFQSSLQDFEIILLDPEHYPTTDGNGIIIVQYQQVTEMIGGSHDVHYSTVGIQAPGGLVGLSYRFNNAAAPGAASLSSGRCVVYTTEGRSAFGTITGTVTDAATELPVVGAILTLDGEAYSDTTDAQGTYSLSSVMIGTYTMRARAIGYNEGIVTNLVIEQDSVQEVNFAMLHPEIEVSVEHIDIRLPNDPPEAFFEIINNGNGALDYEIHVAYAPQRGPDDWWTYLDGFDATAATGDVMIQGCELAGDYWWVTGTGTEGVPKLYRFDLDGNFVDALPQPAGNEYGWMDMAFDGTYLYGSSGPAIIGVDLTGVVRDTIPTPLDPARAIAHDPQTDHFWVADYASDIFEINRHGETIRRFPATHRTTGLAWNPADPIGYDLYVFGHTITSEFALVSRFHPQNGDGQLVVTLNREPGDRAGGCTVTPRWNSTLLVFGGIMQNSSSDRLAIWELDFNTTWIAITPMFGSVLGGTSREIEIAFDAGALRDDVYRVDLTLTNNTASGPITLPVSLTVALPAGEPQPAPVTYALYQNQPNPFNATTTIRYDLAQPGWVRLQVFNVLGQEVSVPISEFHAAGSHQVQLQMNDLPSGLYLYRIESGSFHQTRKLMLLK
ncbi:carboxypeptidase regulatory-like domain-containing protein [bacterium]|nr:carboxypeptidase regulatory-like domain-containing protein [bacterium]